MTQQQSNTAESGHCETDAARASDFRLKYQQPPAILTASNNFLRRSPLQAERRQRDRLHIGTLGKAATGAEAEEEPQSLASSHSTGM